MTTKAESLAELLYEMFLTDENGPRWDGLAETGRRIWRLRATAIIEHLA
jgi:hypothetical protein